MIKRFLHIILCLAVSGSLFAQKQTDKPVAKEWKKIHKQVGYDKSDKYKGPQKGDYTYPKDLDQEPVRSSSSTHGSNYVIQPYQGKPYSPQQIQSGKAIPKNPKGDKSGTLKSDPNIVKPEPAEFPEVEEEEEPQYSTNSSNSSSSYNSNDVSWDGWGTVGIIVLILLGIFIIYLIITSIKPGEKTIPFEPLEEDMNPETISKTELELRLEEAEAGGNYKECVRIYFLFAMKELLNRKMLYWKKEKTNMHYIIEMQGKPGVDDFEKIVSNYDIVWYGDYEIDRDAYYDILPDLVGAYKKLEGLK